LKACPISGSWGSRPTLTTAALNPTFNKQSLELKKKTEKSRPRSNFKTRGKALMKRIRSHKLDAGLETACKAFLIIWATLLVGGCATPISEQALKQADPGITFSDLVKDPEKYRGRVVLLGGQIVTTTVKEGETSVEVVQKPLDGQHQPKDTDDSMGRFLIDYADFRDPAIYAPGRTITIVAEVQGKRTLPLKEIQYTYPVLTPRETHLWKSGDMSEPRFHFGVGVGGIFR
jgi:outer membrane lipoprotein